VSATAAAAVLAFAGAAVLAGRLWWCGRRWKHTWAAFEEPLHGALDAAQTLDYDRANRLLAEALRKAEALRDAEAASMFARRDRLVLTAGIVLLFAAAVLGVNTV
jgi:hypothetical protein